MVDDHPSWREHGENTWENTLMAMAGVCLLAALFSSGPLAAGLCIASVGVTLGGQLAALMKFCPPRDTDPLAAQAESKDTAAVIPPSCPRSTCSRAQRSRKPAGRKPSVTNPSKRMHARGSRT